MRSVKNSYTLLRHKDMNQLENNLTQVTPYRRLNNANRIKTLLSPDKKRRIKIQH